MAEATWRALAPQVADGRGPWRLPTEPASRPEELLALVARARLTDDDMARIRALGQSLSEPDWHAVMTQALAGYTATLVYAQIAAVGLLPSLPPAISAGFADHYRTTLLTNLRIRTALERLLDQFAAAGIATVPLKGVVLAERVYHNIGWRFTRDIDLLVRHEDVHRAGLLLRAGGYIPEHGQERASAFAAIATGETKYTRENAPLIELHWGLSKRPAYRHGLAVNAIWERTLPETWRGRAIQTLAPGDEMRFLAVHCTADHRHSQLNWLVDITELARGLPGSWDWDEFAAETIAAGVAAPVGLALAQCRAVLQLDVPEETLALLLRAGLSTSERAAWQSAWAERLSRTWIAAHLRTIPTRRERALFTAGALARVAANTASKRLRRAGNV